MNGTLSIKEHSFSRDVAIDAARGVALFLVVLSHAHHIPHYMTAFYIMAFFFISGWLYKPGRNYKENVAKKTTRVLVPYFVNSIILLIIYAFCKSFSIQQIQDAILGIVYSRNYITYTGVENPIMGSIANNPLWYLTAFFSTSLLFHAIVDHVTKNWGQLVWVSMVLLSISILLVKIPFFLPWSMDMVPFCTIIMMVGYMLKKTNFHLNLSGLPIVCLLLVYVVFCQENGPINLSVRNFGGGQIATLAIGITGSMICISLCYKLAYQPLLRIFEYVGTNSIVTLSYHLLFIGLIRNFIRKFLLSGISIEVEQTFWYDVIVVCIAVALCISIGKFFELIRNKMEG